MRQYLIYILLPFFSMGQTVTITNLTKMRANLKANGQTSVTASADEEAEFRILNNSDSLMRLIINPNDTISIQDPAKKCAKLLLIGKGTGKLKFILKPKASLKAEIKSTEIRFTNLGRCKLKIVMKKGADFQFIRDESGCEDKPEPEPAVKTWTDNCCCGGHHHIDQHENENTHKGHLQFDPLCCCCIIYCLEKGINAKETNTVESSNGEKIGVSFRVYNDANGFNPDQTNAILQSEASFNLPISRKPIWTTSTFRVYALKNAVFPTIKFVQLKKDSSYRFAPVHYSRINDSSIVDTTINIHTLNLVRYSNFNINAKVNLITIQSLHKTFTLYIDLYGAFYRSGFVYTDSILLQHLGIKKEDASFHVQSAGLGFNIKARYKPLDSHFSLEAAVTQFGLNLYSNDIRQNFGMLHNPDYNPKNDDITKLKFNPGFNPYFNGIGEYSIQIGYCKELKNRNNPSGKGFFFRLNFYNSPVLTTRAGSTKVSYANNYLQIQTGISRDLSDLLIFLGLAN